MSLASRLIPTCRTGVSYVLSHNILPSFNFKLHLRSHSEALYDQLPHNFTKTALQLISTSEMFDNKGTYYSPDKRLKHSTFVY